MAVSLMSPVVRWQVRGAAQWRAPDQKCVRRGWLQDLQVQNQAQADWGDQAVSHGRQTRHHR